MILLLNMSREENFDFIVPVIQGEDAKRFYKHFTTCFIAVSKHQAVYSENVLVEVKESYELIQSLVKEE